MTLWSMKKATASKSHGGAEGTGPRMPGGRLSAKRKPQFGGCRVLPSDCQGALGKRKKGAAGQRFVSPIPRSDHPAADENSARSVPRTVHEAWNCQNQRSAEHYRVSCRSRSALNLSIGAWGRLPVGTRLRILPRSNFS